MYDVLVKSTLFGVRNADKVINTEDKGKIFADVGQFTNAARSAAQLDNALGKGAQAAIDAMGAIAKENKALQMAAKGADWASRHVNPLLVGAAGYRVLVSDDKETALKREILGMSAMFGVEGLMKVGLQSQKMKNIRNNIKNKKLSALLSAAEGIFFVIGSIAGSTAGYKIGKSLFPDKEKVNNKNFDWKELNNIAEKNKKLAETETKKKDDDIDESEYFALKSKEKTLA